MKLITTELTLPYMLDSQRRRLAPECGLLTVRQAAVEFELSVSSVYRLIQQRKIHNRGAGSTVLVDPIELGKVRGT